MTTPKYTNRTCCNCGIRKPQPEMIKKEIEVEVGKSVADIDGSSWLGVAAGDAASKRAVARATFNSSQRTYTRKQTKWFCHDCAKPVKSVTKSNDGSIKSTPLWVWLFWFIIICLTLSLFGY